MGARRVEVRRGKHFGWWVHGKWESGRTFMLTWWPSEGIANRVARWFGGK
jgi:hypothetical protein